MSEPQTLEDTAREYLRLWRSVRESLPDQAYLDAYEGFATAVANDPDWGDRWRGRAMVDVAREIVGES